MNDREALRVPKWFERAHRRMQTEESVEIDRGLGIARLRLRNPDRGPRRVVIRFTKRHHYIEAIDCAALKDCNQRFALTASERVAEHDALEKRRRGKRHADACQRDAA